MLTKSQAIVLHTVKYGESQLIIDTFTEELGRLSFVCHIPTSAKARVKKQFFQPMTLLNVELDYRAGSRLQRFKDVYLGYSYSSIPFNPFKLSITLFLTDFLRYATRNEQVNRSLFQYITNSMMWLDDCKDNFANFHLVFMMRLSRFVGFFPNLEDYQEGNGFDLRNGCFCSVPPLHPYFLGPEEAARLLTLMRINYETMRLFTMSHADRNRCAEVILQYYRLHVPSFPELKSLDVLKELFA